MKRGYGRINHDRRRVNAFLRFAIISPEQFAVEKEDGKRKGSYDEYVSRKEVERKALQR